MVLKDQSTVYLLLICTVQWERGMEAATGRKGEGREDAESLRRGRWKLADSEFHSLNFNKTQLIL